MPKLGGHSDKLQNKIRRGIGIWLCYDVLGTDLGCFVCNPTDRSCLPLRKWPILKHCVGLQGSAMVLQGPVLTSQVCPTDVTMRRRHTPTDITIQACSRWNKVPATKGERRFEIVQKRYYIISWGPGQGILIDNGLIKRHHAHQVRSGMTHYAR